MYTGRTTRRIQIAAAIGVLGIVVAILLHRGPRFPSVADPAALRRDAAELAHQNPEGRIASGKWPESIAELRPQAVVRDGGYLLVTLKGGGIGADPYGYVVQVAVPAQTPSHWRLYETGHEGIYRCFWGERYPQEKSFTPIATPRPTRTDRP